MDFLITRNREPDVSAARRSFADSVRTPSREIELSGGLYVLLTDARADDFAAAFDDRNALLLLGTQRVTEADLRRELRSFLGSEDADSLFRRVPGSFFTVVAWDDTVTVFGSLSGIRTVMTESRGRFVGSDGDLIRRAAGASIADEHLPLLLMVLRPPSLTHRHGPWRGVHATPQDHAVRITLSGFAVRPRWSPPAPSDRLDVVTPALRAAIDAAIAARHGSGRVSTDLSGGMDSTTLAFFAAAQDPRLVTVFRPSVDPANDDAMWRARAQGALPEAEHIDIPIAATAPWFSEWRQISDRSQEAPLPSTRTSSYLRVLAAAVGGRGVRRHITGIGGDELFHASFALIREHTFSHPRWAWAAARRARAMGRWSWSSTARALTSRESSVRWRRRTAVELESLARPDIHEPPRDWEPRPLLPEWSTPLAVEAVRDTLLEMRDTSPDSFGLTAHEMMSLLGLGGLLVRRFSHLLEAEGVSYEAPLLDDRVVEIAMSVSPLDRIQGNAYKPVLAAAARGVVPEGLIGRQTKGDYSREAFAGLRSSRVQILDGFARSELALRGLIDIDRFRASIDQVHSRTDFFQFLDPTLAAEGWLRGIQPQVAGGGDR